MLKCWMWLCGAWLGLEGARDSSAAYVSVLPPLWLGGAEHDQRERAEQEGAGRERDGSGRDGAGLKAGLP